MSSQTIPPAAQINAAAAAAFANLKLSAEALVKQRWN